MDEIVWIRPAGYDPAVQPGTILRPDAGLPEFRVLARRPVVMMFHAGPAWDIRPFTQLTLRLVAPEETPVRAGSERSPGPGGAGGDAGSGAAG
jgi:hypothetical protein